LIKEQIMSISSLGSSASDLSTSDVMGSIRSQHEETMAMTLETAQMSKEEGLANAYGKFMKACGDNVKAMAP
jgi:hypothetical protein